MDENRERKLLRQLEKARENNKVQDVEWYSRRLADFYSQQGRYKEALKFYKEELHIVEKMRDDVKIANAHRMICDTYDMMNQHEEALKHCNLFLEFSKKANDKVEEQRAYTTKGNVYFSLALSHKNDDKTKFDLYIHKCTTAHTKSLRICENELKNLPGKERYEMKARALYNLGIAADLQGHLKTAQNHIRNAIQVCKTENLKEDLQRCYLQQGELYLKEQDLAKAIKFFDLAKNISTSQDQIFNALSHKADALILMCNYAVAKNVLLEIYKMKLPNENAQKLIKKKLYATAKLCKLHKELSEMPEEEFETRKKLYEDYGDTCCLLKNYSHALELYLKMLDCAQKAGHTGRDLLPCYTSLSQTYKDDKQYDLALTYSKKELEIIKNEPQEAIKTYLIIAELLELSNADYIEIQEAYDKVITLAREINDNTQLYTGLKRLLKIQHNLGKTDVASKTEKELNLLKEEHDFSSDDEDEVEEDSQDVGSEINDSDLKEIVSDLEDNNEDQRLRTRVRRKALKVRKNEKGETPLHVAAIKGQYSRAKQLIEQGHSVKDHDQAGWSPLHEACNHNFIDIVTLLLDNGADINDIEPGITPLHDAASNGHFELVELLIKRGASTAALTKSGETPYDSLKDWKKRVEEERKALRKDDEAGKALSEDEEATYNRLLEMLKPPVEFHKMKRNIRMNSQQLSESPFINENESEHQIKKPRTNITSKLKSLNNDFNLRRCSDEASSSRKWFDASPEKNDSLKIDSSSDEEIKESASKEYQNAINIFRKPQKFKLMPEITSKKTKSALIDEKDYVDVDHWLEDDLGIEARPQKRRKVGTDLVERSSIKNRMVQQTEESHKEKENEIAMQDSEDDLPEVFNIIDHLEDNHQVENTNENQRNGSPILFSTSRIHEVQSNHLRRVDSVPRLTSQPTQVSNVQTDFISNPNFLKVRVKVQQKLLLIPIQMQTINELTVGWLADEASRRYSQLEGAEPILRLKTKDGGIFSEQDPLSMVQNEELEGEIIEWKTISLSECYKKACSTFTKTKKPDFCGYQFNNNPDVYVMSALDACAATKCLDLSYLSLTNDQIAPVFKVLKHQKYLKCLNLAGNVLGDKGISLLTECLEECHIEDVNLSCNNLSTHGITQFTESLSKMYQSLYDIKTLDFSFNPIGESSLKMLKKLSEKMVNLTSVKTDFCDLLQP